MESIEIRPERAEDRAALRTLLEQAFPTPAEADLVDALREEEPHRISRVAIHPERGLLGQLLLTPVRIETSPEPTRAMGLGPMAVAPPFQRRGIGSRLVEDGLAACRAQDQALVVVLGHEAYYPRFGFRPAGAAAGLSYGGPGPNPAFMACELEPGALRGYGGEVRYAPAFRRMEPAPDP